MFAGIVLACIGILNVLYGIAVARINAIGQMFCRG